MSALIASRARSTLVLVQRGPLLDQWVVRLGEFLDIGSDGIGTTIDSPGSSGIDVAMIQSLGRRDLSELERHGHLVIDECHHAPPSRRSGCCASCRLVR